MWAERLDFMLQLHLHNTSDFKIQQILLKTSSDRGDAHAEVLNNPHTAVVASLQCLEIKACLQLFSFDASSTYKSDSEKHSLSVFSISLLSKSASASRLSGLMCVLIIVKCVSSFYTYYSPCWGAHRASKNAPVLFKQPNQTFSPYFFNKVNPGFESESALIRGCDLTGPYQSPGNALTS